MMSSLALHDPPTATAAARPRLRGVSHAWAVAFAIPAVLVLAHHARTPRAWIAASIYGAGLVTLFAVSALYHRIEWSPAARARMRKVDHSNIFVFIASSYTPIHLLGVGGAYGTTLCEICWAGAIVGVLQTIFWPTAPRALHLAAYLVVGWTGALSLVDLTRHTGAASGWALFVGGLLYSAGAVVYARKRPEPWPGVFGHHEVFHALVIAACVCLYVVEWRCVACAM
jgi:hemolysin III